MKINPGYYQHRYYQPSTTVVQNEYSYAYSEFLIRDSNNEIRIKISEIICEQQLSILTNYYQPAPLGVIPKLSTIGEWGLDSWQPFPYNHAMLVPTTTLPPSQMTEVELICELRECERIIREFRVGVVGDVTSAIYASLRANRISEELESRSSSACL